MADTLEGYLIQNNLPATSIHGDRTQQERERALYTFKVRPRIAEAWLTLAERPHAVPRRDGRRCAWTRHSGSSATFRALLTSQNVTHVINYDLPGDIGASAHPA